MPELPSIVINTGPLLARLHGLQVTGSLGILLKAAKAGEPIDLPLLIERMRAHRIWISGTTEQAALRLWKDIRTP